MTRPLHVAFGVSIALLMTLVPYSYYRWSYAYGKRLRVVTEGKVYRSGCMTGAGFEQALKKYGIRTVLNLQEEATDPDLPRGFPSRETIKESELCEQLGVKFVFLSVDLQNPVAAAAKAPEALKAYLDLLDDPSSYPMLVHCQAGLHRTGVLVAVYRMEYEGWSRYEALQELRAHGFGRTQSNSPNEYIRQYILNYQPRAHLAARPVAAQPVSRHDTVRVLP